MSIILGIDPGSRVAGFGIVELSGGNLRHVDHGVIRLSEKKPLSFRLGEIYQAMDQILNTYKPKELAIENIFLGKNPQSAFTLGHVRGVCMERGVAHGLGIFEYASRVVKKSLTGSGNANKEQVQQMVTALLKIGTNLPFDATDALAVAMTHGRHVKNISPLDSKECL